MAVAGEARTPAPGVEVGLYLTDGLRLFRVVSGLTWPPEESWATLEECRTLEQGTYTPDELWRMGLKPVTPRGPARPEGLPGC